MEKTILTRGGLPVSSQQAAVVDSVVRNRLTVVGAGAGSGKTHTTAAAVLELLEQRKANLDQLVLITYTNTAADNIRNRIEKEIKKRLKNEQLSEEVKAFWRSQSERISSAYIGTIHSFCRMVLSTYGYDQKIARSADMTYAVYQRQQVFQEAINKHIESEHLPKLLDYASGYKDYELRSLLDKALEEVYSQGFDMKEVWEWTKKQKEDPFKDPGKPLRNTFATMLYFGHLKYKQKKLEKPALDAHDLLYHTNLLFLSDDGPVTIQRLTQRYRYFFVDEFQDTNRLQLEIVKKLLPADQASPSMAGVLVVGDQKQSIFGFSGAYASLLFELARERGVKVLPMNVARRPTLEFLNLQNKVFETVGKRLPELNEKLQPYEGTFQPLVSLPPLTFLAAPADTPTADKVNVMAGHIRHLLQQVIHPAVDQEPRLVLPGDIVILTRNNRQLQDYLVGLSEALPDISFRSDRGSAFYHKPEIVATYRILRAIIHYPDDYILSQAVGGPYLAGVDATEIENIILNYGTKEGTPLTDKLTANYPALFAQLAELRRKVKVATVPQFLESLYRAFNVRQHYAHDPEAILALEKLREIARNLFSNDQALTLRTFVDYLEHNILAGNTYKEEAAAADNQPETPDHVRLMTIHRAKGLEFPIVIVPDAHKEIITESYSPDFLVLPGHGIEVKIKGRRSVSGKYYQVLKEKKRDQFAEEMRVFYVAMTRAEQAVVVIGTEPVLPPSDATAWNSWQDPLWAAREELEKLSAEFIYL